MSGVLVTCKLVSDLEADYAQQQESREERVEENKIKCVSGQSTRISLINDLTPMRDQTSSRQRSGSIWNDSPRQRESVNSYLVLQKRLKFQVSAHQSLLPSVLEH